MLLLALSCLQGRPMATAFDELCAYDGVDGVQLTPGNMPTPDFEAHVAASRRSTRTHHGFTPVAFKTRQVWADDGRCTVASDSVHPPRADSAAVATFLAQPSLPILETMYPGWALGDGAALDDAMRRQLRLAVDVSHLFMQREQGLIGDATLARLLDYEHVVEVHVSANDGRRDLHWPLAASSYGLAWARARLAAGVPVILECYFHRLSERERRGQIELVLTGATRWPTRPTTRPTTSTTSTRPTTATTSTRPARPATSPTPPTAGRPSMSAE